MRKTFGNDFCHSSHGKTERMFTLNFWAGSCSEYYSEYRSIFTTFVFSQVLADDIAYTLAVSPSLFIYVISLSFGPGHLSGQHALSIGHTRTPWGEGIG